MNRNVLAMMLLAATSVAWAQQGTTRLQCDGKSSDFLRGTRDYLDVVKDGKLAGPGAEAIIAVLTEYSLIKDPAIYRRIGVHSCDGDGRLNRDSLEADLAFFSGQGLIQGKVDVASALDTSIAEDAVRSLGPYVRK